MAPSKAIIKMQKPRYFVGAVPVYSTMDIWDRVKVPGKDAFTSREWEPGTIVQIETVKGLYGPAVTGVALIRFDNKHLGELRWRIERLQYEHTEDELVEQTLGDYFA